MSARRITVVLLLAAAALGAAEPKAAGAKSKAPAVAVPLTEEQKAGLRALDVRMAGLDALLAKVTDAEYRAKEVKAVADLKRRRADLERNFDPMTYESLMHSVISRYQIIALWLTPPREPAPRS